MPGLCRRREVPGLRTSCPAWLAVTAVYKSLRRTTQHSDYPGARQFLGCSRQVVNCVKASLIDPANTLAPTARPQQTMARISTHSIAAAPSSVRQNPAAKHLNFLIAGARPPPPPCSLTRYGYGHNRARRKRGLVQTAVARLREINGSFITTIVPRLATALWQRVRSLAPPARAGRSLFAR